MEKEHKLLKCCFCAMAFFLLFSFRVEAQYYGHAIEICERYYEDGEYQKALDNCEKLIDRLIDDRIGYAHAEAQLFQAKYLEALGRYDEFEVALQSGLRKKKLAGEKSLTYGKALLDIAHIYLIYSDLTSSETYLNQAYPILNVDAFKDAGVNVKERDPYFEALYIEIKAKIHAGRGKFTSAKALLPKLLELRQERITANRELFFDPVSQKFKERKLDFFQVRRRKREYANVLTLQASLERREGNYQEALRYLEDAEIWIKQELNGKDLAYIRHQHELALTKMAIGQDIYEVKKILEKNLFLAERRLTLVHKEFMGIHEAIIDFYILTKFSRRGKNQELEISINTERYFGSETTKYATAQRLRAKMAFFSNDDFRSVMDQLESLYNDTGKVPVNHEERVKLLKLMYQVSLSSDNYLMARGYLDDLMKAQKIVQGPTSLDQHYSQMMLADYTMQFTNDFASADSLIQQSFYGYIDTVLADTHQDYVPFLKQCSEYYEVVGKYDSATQLVNKAVGIMKEKHGENHWRYAMALERLSDIDLSLGQFNEADQGINDMLDIFKENRYKRRWLDPQYAQVLETSARYYATMGLFDDARNYLWRANRMNSRSNASIANSTAIDELAYLYITTGRYDDTEKLLNEAITIREERFGPSSRFLITPYNQLARVAYLRGNYTGDTENRGAEQYANDALKIAQTIYGEDALQTTESVIMKGDIYTAIGDYEQAKESFEKTLEIKKGVLGEEHVEIAQLYTKLALTKLYNEEPLPEVEVLFQQSVDIIANVLGKDNPIYAASLKDLALVYTENNKLSEASESLNTANSIWIDKLGSSTNIHSAEIELLLGDIELKQFNTDAAIERYQNSQKAYKKLFNKNHPSYVNAISRLGRAYYAGSNYGKSKKFTEEAIRNYFNYIESFFPALSTREKTKYWLKIKKDFDFYVNLAVADEKDKKLLSEVYNNMLATKALLVSSSRKIRNQILSSNDQALKDNYQVWLDKKEELTKVLALPSEQQKEEGIDPRKLEKEIDTIEKELSASSNLFSSLQSTDKYTWQDVQKVLAPGEAAVEIIRYQYFDRAFTDSVIYMALIVTPETKSVPQQVIFPKGKELETRYLKYYRSCIQYDIEDEESYRAFWEPIANVLPSGAKVYLSMEGVFNQVNIESIRINEEEYVIDRNNIILVTNTKDLLEQEENSGGGTSGEMMVMGNPVFYRDLTKKEFNTYTDRQVTQLPGAYKEVVQLEKMFANGRSSLSIVSHNLLDATEEEVKSMKNPTIFHVATHGFFLSDEEEDISENSLKQDKEETNPLLRAGLLLKYAGDLVKGGNVYSFNREGGVLTAYEAMDLNLDETELVVLSACETGRGDVKVGEGVYGLQRAFMVAGADAIIMSLFKVSDDATQKLMVFFYDNWLKKRMGKRAAFIEAKRQLREEYKEPKYWGAFIMVGSV